ncbi:tetratricopeptide repeat-containing sensor histidine kinase [Gaoshiqia sp. Z1-71]|uniref:tetratricopeptide repeat-containing sensor histidine kinase n=1 Tax=Gaoshiqia hydrogeniformans TaxID=3290090 RepID=UPI003BF8CACB
MMMKFYLLPVFFLSFQVSLFAQGRDIDLLKSKLIHSGQHEKLAVLLDLAYCYLDSANNYATTLEYLNEASQLAVQLEDDSAKIVLQNYYGLANYFAGNYETATACFYAGLALAESCGNQLLKSKFLNNLGLIYIELEDYDKAIEFYRQSYRIDSLAGDETGMLLTRINTAVCYQKKQMSDTAFYMNEELYDLAKKVGDSLSVIHILNNQGTIEYERKNYAKSLDFYFRALELYQAMDNQDGIATTYVNIGTIHLEQKDFALAKSYFEKAQTLVSKFNLFSLSAELYFNLSDYYEAVGDYKNAHLFYHKYHEVNDSIAGEKKNLMIRKLEAQYNMDKKTREIEQLQHQNQQQHQELINRKLQQSFLYLFMLLVISCLVVVFLLLRKERKLGLQLKEKTLELKRLNNTRDKFFSIIAHDLKNPFNALISYTSLLREDFERFSREEILQIIADLNNATEQGFKLLENLLHWTRSQTDRIKVFRTRFNLLCLCKEVEELARPNLNEKSQQLIIDVHSNLMVFADRDMIATVIRNLVYNAIKFSQRGKSIRMVSELDKDMVKLSIIDQGIGINESDLERIFQYDENTTTHGTEGEIGSGLGLLICREFIGKNGGEIRAYSHPGEGATFCFTIPFSDFMTSKNG